MKKTPGHSLHQSDKRKRNVGVQERGAGNGTQRHSVENHTFLTYFKNFFSSFLSGKRKSAPEAPQSDDRKGTHKVGGVSCKFEE